MTVLGPADSKVTLRKPQDDYFTGNKRDGTPPSIVRKKIQALTNSPIRQQSGTSLQSWYRTNRNLTPLQYFTLYMKTPDIRSAIDAIVRRVATWDWNVEPSIEPSDANYASQAAAAEEVKRFLQMPNGNRQTWQEMMTQMVTDLLIYDAGVLELVGTSDADLEEDY